MPKPKTAWNSVCHKSDIYKYINERGKNKLCSRFSKWLTQDVKILTNKNLRNRWQGHPKKLKQQTFTWVILVTWQNMRLQAGIEHVRQYSTCRCKWYYCLYKMIKFNRNLGMQSFHQHRYVSQWLWNVQFWTGWHFHFNQINITEKHHSDDLQVNH